MATNNETTTKFKVDISELVSGMQTAKRQISLANAEFKSATAGMDDWAKSADGVSAKLTQLDKTLDNQKKILGSLEEQYRLTVAQMGEGSKEADNLKIKIENQKASIAKTEKEIRNYSKSLDDIQSGASDATRATDNLDDSLSEVGDSADKASDGFTVLKGAVATFAGNMATQAVGAIKNAIGAIAGLSESTREFRQDMATLDTAFSEANLSSEQATATWKELYGVFGEDDRAVEASNNIARMAQSQEDLDAWVKITAGTWGTYQDALPVESLAESAGETAKVGTVTGALADALNWSSEASQKFAKYMGEDVVTAEDAFNVALSECTTEQERQALITSTLTDLYGEAGDKYNETASSVTEANKATADLTLAQAEMGERIEPIITSVRTGFATLLGKILELTNGVDFQAFAGKIAGGFDYFINNILPVIMDGLGWIIDNSDLVLAGIVGIGTAFIAWKAVGIVTAVTKALNGMTIAQYALNLAMNLNPIGIIITLLAGLVAGFVVLWNKSEAFRNFFIKMWDNIKKVVSTVVSAIVGFFKNLWDSVTKIFEALPDWFNNTVIEPISGFFSDLWTGISDGASQAWDFIAGVFEGVANWFNDTLIQPVANFFSGMWDGLRNGASQAWQGIKDIFSSVANFFGSIFSEAWQRVKDVFSVGGKIFDGIKDGIVSAFKTIVNAIIRGINKVVSIPFNAINGVLNGIKSIEILGIKPFDWIGNIAVPQIPELYQGGVLRRGQVGYLEGNGDEAVVPLDKNTGWLDEVASRIVAKGGLAGSQAQTVNNNYNYDFNQTNNSPKALSRLEIYRQTKNITTYGMGVV